MAKGHYDGAAGWGLIGAAQAIGLVCGGLMFLRARPQRMLLVATLGLLLVVPYLFGLAIPLPLVSVLVLAFAAGLGIETFGVLWDTTMQQEIPQDRLSRVYSYDALGSFALIPLGLALAGPLAEAIGTRSDADRRPACSAWGRRSLVLLVPAVRDLRRREPIELREPVLESVA